MSSRFKNLLGRTIGKILINDDYLVFETDQGNLYFHVYGDCCSQSYFHDFIGIHRLLNNGPVTEVKEVELDDAEENDRDLTQCYGFSFTTIDPKFGEVTSLMSFRNESNGYYGGYLNEISELPPSQTMTLLTEDTWLND